MTSRRILIVDDEENIGRSLRMILEREGYAVHRVPSVADFAKGEVPRADAMLFDVKLARWQRHRFAAQVRQSGQRNARPS